MSESKPVERIAEVLEHVGYVRLEVPLKIGEISFDVPAALRGSGISQDLIVVADMAFEKLEARIIRAIEGIARALDVARSKRPLTAIIAGQRPSPAAMTALSKVCRVLPVGVASHLNFESAMNNWLAVLMPLSLPEPHQNMADPLGQIVAQTKSLPLSIAKLVETAPRGALAVRDRFHMLLKEVLSDQEFK